MRPRGADLHAQAAAVAEAVIHPGQVAGDGDGSLWGRLSGTLEQPMQPMSQPQSVTEPRAVEEQATVMWAP